MTQSSAKSLLEPFNTLRTSGVSAYPRGELNEKKKIRRHAELNLRSTTIDRHPTVSAHYRAKLIPSFLPISSKL